MTPNKTLPYGRQTVTQADIDAVVAVLQSDFLTQGPTVGAFEEAFASYIGARRAVALANGTAALHLAAMALGVQPGDTVVTTPITFAASANCVRYCGGDVLFADIDPETYNLDPNAVRALLEGLPRERRKTAKGVVPVDFAGHPADMRAFRDLADEFGLWILEDACHAPGASFADGGVERRCGDASLAEIAAFSFHPVKHVATGEGGALTTNREDLYQRLCLLRTHGIARGGRMEEESHGGWYYEMQELGYNYRLTDIQAALGISQLQRAPEGLERRRAIARRYDEAFAGTNVRAPRVREGFKHAYHLYVVQVADAETRLGLYNRLRSRQIAPQVHYIPVHLQPYYKRLGSKKGDCPVAEAYYERCLSLPMYPALTDKEQDYVIAQVLDFVG